MWRQPRGGDCAKGVVYWSFSYPLRDSGIAVNCDRQCRPVGRCVKLLPPALFSLPAKRSVRQGTDGRTDLIDRQRPNGGHSRASATPSRLLCANTQTASVSTPILRILNRS